MCPQPDRAPGHVLRSRIQAGALDQGHRTRGFHIGKVARPVRLACDVHRIGGRCAVWVGEHTKVTPRLDGHALKWGHPKRALVLGDQHPLRFFVAIQAYGGARRFGAE